ncbi:hypothetical protein BST81_17690 [Leptolyngbya sp. 'hensonii']|uniref:pilus motility taxis protein HmpF n=1 Tax=Leptolyngbya sp. 'hensonii' TaxID=1922337 RepID=UPI00094FEFF4|nr:pilus motility taxis protein HmpF [Leptolyngbya sp. 'hensonii']OLP17181.1 hypothetical protein BST81_17690 [Leptolyngbya sp. 'hensonii']
MLYLAEVQKETAFVGKGKTKLKLLACQKSEQNWASVPGEEVVPSEEAANFNAGALVLADLTANKQVQRVQEAGRQLVSILQNFSRGQEKFKAQEEEIEQWKQSLTYQSQELNRREMEMEARVEELRQMEADFERLDQQRQQVESGMEEASRLREEMERQKQDLEGAWAHLEGEKRRFDELKSELQGKSSLDDEQARRIQDTLNRLASVVAPTESVREQVNYGLEMVSRQQTILDDHWQRLSQHRAATQQMQDELDRQTQEVQRQWQEWHQAQDSLENARSELKAQQTLFTALQEQIQHLESQRQKLDTLQQQLRHLAGEPVTNEELEHMPLEQLQAKVEEMRQDFEKKSALVSEQMEELEAKQQEVEDLKTQIQQASEYDRLSLQADLNDASEGYEMLKETLDPQIKLLKQIEAELKQYQAGLQRRQGYAVEGGPELQIDLEPVLAVVAAQRQQQTERLQHLETEIGQIQTMIQQLQDTIAQQSSHQDSQRQHLKHLEENLKGQLRSVAEIGGRVNVYQDLLQPAQDNTTDLRQRLEGINGMLAQFQETGDYQLQAINEIRQVVQSLVNVPEMAAS